jgi:uncharacterized protein
MKLPRWVWTLCLALLLAASAQAQQLVAVPPLAGHVTDLAGMLEPGQRARLDAQLRDYESKTGSQIAVLLVPSTAPEAIEQYSIRVTDAWKLGRKGIDDGVLLVVARDNPKALRRLRIEAGRGVQGSLTDAQSKRILQDVIAPHFRQNDYIGGLMAGTGAIAALLDKEHIAAPTAKPQSALARAGDTIGNVFTIFMLVAGAGFLLLLYRARRGGGIAAPSALSDHHWGSAATGFIIGNVLSDIAHNANRHSGYSGGGFSGGDSGGGFSGGGGSFDGGGASGDW